MPQKKGDLRVWWIPQVPGEPFRVPVQGFVEAWLVLTTLADYDNFQFENKIKPDFSNAGGLEEFDGKEWQEWEDNSGQTISDLLENDEWLNLIKSQRG